MYIFTLYYEDTQKELAVSFMPLLLYTQGNSHQYPPYRRLDIPHNQPACYKEGQSLLDLPGIEPQTRSFRPVVQHMYRQSYEVLQFYSGTS
jgi:hypothetical protein